MSPHKRGQKIKKIKITNFDTEVVHFKVFFNLNWKAELLRLNLRLHFLFLAALNRFYSIF